MPGSFAESLDKTEPPVPEEEDLVPQSRTNGVSRLWTEWNQAFFIQIRAANLCVRLPMTKRQRVKLPGNRPFPHAVLPQDQDRTVAFGNVSHYQTYLFAQDKWTLFEHQVSDHSLLTAKVSNRTSPNCNALSKPRMAGTAILSL